MIQITKPDQRRLYLAIHLHDGFLYVATVERILGPGAPVGANVTGTIYRIEPAQ